MKIKFQYKQQCEIKINRIRKTICVSFRALVSLHLSLSLSRFVFPLSFSVFLCLTLFLYLSLFPSSQKVLISFLFFGNAMTIHQKEFTPKNHEPIHIISESSKIRLMTKMADHLTLLHIAEQRTSLNTIVCLRI